MIHEIKLAKEFCHSVENGNKTFEIRLNDRNYRAGDCVKFIPWDSIKNKKSTKFRNLEETYYEITYLLSGWGLNDGYVAFSIAPITNKSIVSS